MISAAAARKLEKAQMLRKGGRPRSPTAYVRPEVPGATIGGGNFCDEVPDVPLVPAILGSSQLQGICPGDFCDYNVDGLNPLTAAVSSTASAAMSNFRRRIAAMENRSTSTVLEDDDDPNATDQQERKRRGRSTRRGSTFRTRFIDASKAAAVAGVEMKESDPLAPNLLISFRSIAQARQEAQLVKMHLIRVAHGAGTAGDYVTENNQAQMDAVAALSAKMAPIYYKEVPVCAACYAVYTVVDQARQLSLQNLAARRRERALLQKARPQTAPHSMPMPMSHSLSQPLSQSQVLLPKKTSLIGKNKQHPAPQADASAPADVPSSVSAVLGLTKHDVSEIRRMASPPAAVEVVVEAVLALLTGRALSFQEARRHLAADSFLPALHNFRAEDVTDARLRLAEPFADNPLFRPVHVMPINPCAAKFCAWVLGMVALARDLRFRDLTRASAATADVAAAAVEGPGAVGGPETVDGDGEEDSWGPTVDDVAEPGAAYAAALVVEDPSLDDLSLEAPLLPAAVPAPAPAPVATAKRPVTASAVPDAGDKENNSVGDSWRRPGSRVGLKPPMLGGPAHPHLPPVVDDQHRARAAKKAVHASQQRAADRLSSQKEMPYTPAASGPEKTLHCADGMTSMPYVVAGTLSVAARYRNFVVVHDFFETFEASAALMRHVTARRDGCQALCFNYPGQRYVRPRATAPFIPRVFSGYPIIE